MNKKGSVAAVIYIPAQENDFADGGIAPVAPIHVFPATERHLSQIIACIQGLGDYEHLPVTATEEGLRDALFGPHPAAEVLLAYCGSACVGFALFFPTFCAMAGKRGLFLENIFVRTDWRGRGVGDALLTRLAEIAIERKAVRIQWSVLNWNESAIKFYQSRNAALLDEWTICRMDEAAIHRLVSDHASPAHLRLENNDEQMRLEFFN